ncbi:acyltransferase family protein [Anaerobacillus sp. MEB173]|uniref:acyltransferase family protein n=1 Tax=Anaerobacillus sp. MEB173 TaxID=3383345 RepID=UPI003F8F2CED
MKNPSMINEMFVLRSIACLSIVFLHSIDIAMRSLSIRDLGVFAYQFFDSLQMFLYFGTPAFIFISEFIIAYSYRSKKIPDHFLAKRVKYILLPFLFMAFFYSIPYATSFSDWSIKFFLNAVIGDFHGYFVLIIFQFYFAHLIFHRYLKNNSPVLIIMLSFIINIAYLAFFNFTQPWNIPYAEYIWNRFYWVLLFGWIFYFSVGYYCGLYYEAFIEGLHKYKYIVLLLPIVTSSLLLLFYHFDIVTIHSSKRVDILFHAIAISFFILYIAKKLKNTPPLLILISQYSFGIYLLHMFYISIVDFLFQRYDILIGATYIFVLFLFSTVSSILTIHYMNKWQYGKFFIGKLGIGPKTNSATNVIVQHKSNKELHST